MYAEPKITHLVIEVFKHSIAVKLFVIALLHASEPGCGFLQ
jgi:hypothetical protein